jgi:hypothetical protein
MSTNFPDSLDTLTNPSSTDALSSPSHSQQHANANDAIEALQTKVGIDGSQDVNSLDYKVADAIAQLQDIANTTSIAEVLLGLEGNNDLTVAGIENKTAVDEFSKTAYRTVSYKLQISKGSEYATSDILLLNDGTNLNVVESNIISNTNSNLANVTFEENSGIISLNVAPISGSVTARYYRTSLKS